MLPSSPSSKNSLCWSQNYHTSWPVSLSTRALVAARNSTAGPPSHNELRVRFAQWLENQVTEILEDEEGQEICPPRPRYNNSLVVDESVLQTLKTSPSLDRYSKALKKSPYLKAIKASHDDADEDRLAPKYSGRNDSHEGLLFPGFMRIPLIFLRDFWEVTSEYVDIIEICPVTFKEELCWDPEQEYLNEL
ncbi:hypothetical protein KCU65_g346, partial [Aureobasidium melanogenum]